MDERIRKLVDLAETSDYNYVIMTGCGEEQEMWENIKQKLINKSYCFQLFYLLFYRSCLRFF